MIVHEYAYSLNLDFPGDAINKSQLADEIFEKGINEAVDAINVDGDTIQIVLRGAYSANSKALLDEVVSSHIPMSIRLVDTVEVLEEREYRTQGNFQTMMYKWDIPAGDPGEWTTLTPANFPFSISALNLEWYNNLDVAGDEAQLLVAPDTIIGFLAADVTTGGTILQVTDTVANNTQIGFHLYITDGSIINDLGRCLAINKVNHTVTVENPLLDNFLASTPCYILQTIELSPRIHITESVISSIGGSRIGGTHIPANTDMVVRYRNNSGEAKQFVLLLEYLY